MFFEMRLVAPEMEHSVRWCLELQRWSFLEEKAGGQPAGVVVAYSTGKCHSTAVATSAGEVG